MAAGSPSRRWPDALRHLGAAAAAAVDRGHRGADEVAGRDPALDEVGRDRDEQLRLVGVEPKRHDPRPEALADAPRRALEGLHRFVRRGVRHQPDARARAPPRPPPAGPASRARPPPPARSRFFASRSSSCSAPIRSGHRIDGLGAGRLGRPLEGVEPRPDERVRAGAGHRLDAPRPRPDAPLRGDEEPADLAAGAAMRAAAQLERVVLDADGPDRLAVLLVEEGVRAALDRLGHAHERDGDGPVLADDAADLVLDRAPLVVGQRPVEREVEAQAVRRHERAGLPGALPDDVAQRPVEQVRARVVAHRVGAPIGVDLGADGLADPQPAAKRPAMDDRGRRAASGCPRRRRGRCRRPARAGRRGRRPGRRPRRRTASGRGRPRRRRGRSARRIRVPSRRIATTRPSAVVVS